MHPWTGVAGGDPGEAAPAQAAAAAGLAGRSATTGSGSAADGDLPAGDFSAWLTGIRQALRSKTGSDVACGDCIGCCVSAYYIHIRADDVAARRRIPAEQLRGAPDLPSGDSLMGYDARGICPMLRAGRCSIYDDRPQTCRDYDCRIFAAAGLRAGAAAKAAINERVRRWRFSYPGEQDRADHAAVQQAARFIRNKASAFPDGRASLSPNQVAILAIKAYRVFLDRDAVELESEDHPADAAIAAATLDAAQRFDSAGEAA